MSAPSGIELADQLKDVFAEAVQDPSTRFLKIAIKNEKLVHETTVKKRADDLAGDLPQLQNTLEDKTPAYILARQDGDGNGWLFISYVPDDATVRDKMLYASSRGSLVKSLGSTNFTDNIFATSKEDISEEAYAAHRRHINAPKPQTSQEKEMEQVREAERGGSLEGSRGRRNHVGTRVGINWSEEAERAVTELGEEDEDKLVILSIDVESETLIAASVMEEEVDYLGGSLPSEEPCFAFFSWKHNHAPTPRRDIIFIYSCPSTSPIKGRMVYSLAAASLLQTAKTFLAGSKANLVAKKLETSDPSEINAEFIVSRLNLDREDPEGNATTSRPGSSEPKAFAKPRGPGRRVPR
ncbi:actin depolymerizing protein [Schizopora paradoxa]|uniref:Actin depolymerizing protein n=1 Tax=Schizopora paradoxa TaxID=27342 RepID=A0A0H2S9L5_9AGAM|nr:actin depolymerizing protein [Schizopora paradoxa]